MLAHASRSLKSVWYICWFAYQVFSIFSFLLFKFLPLPANSANKTYAIKIILNHIPYFVCL